MAFYFTVMQYYTFSVRMIDFLKIALFGFHFCLFFKWELRLKFQHCFLHIFVLVLWRNNPVQSFDLLFSQSYEVTKFWIRRKWRPYPRMYIPFHLFFILLVLRRKISLQSHSVHLPFYWGVEPPTKFSKGGGSRKNLNF